MNPPSTPTIKRTSRPQARHHKHPRAHRAEPVGPEPQSPDPEQNGLTQQRLTIVLAGITASDYLTWIRDPDPPALGRELRSVDVHADPLGDRLDVLMRWNTDPPTPQAAAPAAGFHLTPEVIELRPSHL